MRQGYVENAPGDEGWRDPPAPLASASSDPHLDPAPPTREWAIGAVRSYLAGRTTVDDLYKASFDLLGYLASESEALSQTELDADLVYCFVDALWSLCLMAIVRDDDADLAQYLSQWLGDLERGEEAWEGPLA